MAGRFRRITARRAVLVVALAVLVDPLGVVQAQNVPTGQEVDRARDAQEHAGRAMADGEARLAALSAELDEARIHAATAVEAYNGARIELSLARRAESSAVAEAAEMRSEREAADVELGRLAAAAYRTGGGWSDLGVVLNVVTDASAVNAPEALTTVARSQSVVQARWSAALDEAESGVRTTGRRVAERAAAERAAEAALERAKQAVAEHEDAVARAAATRDDLVQELAAARGTTTELERERQQAEERREQAERERAERRRVEQDGERPAGAATTQEERQDEQQDEQQDAERAGSEAAGEGDAVGEERASAGREPAADGGSARTEEADAASSGPSFAGAAAVERAVDYAHAQLGKPYVWAGAGPAGFDCSGLTMRAWEQGGVQLTHWSVAQARQTARVSYSDLRPGDLVFWSKDDAPSGTYHVGLYIGGGEMIHAPSPGGRVEIQDVFYWRTPSFYTRVVA